MYTLISAVEEMIANQKQHLKYEQEEINNRMSNLDKQRQNLQSLEDDLGLLKQKLRSGGDAKTCIPKFGSY
jgi:septal ring factor EnvC (AmiA/AmiB activator)